MLDIPSKYMRRELTNVMQTVLDFRSIVRKYLLNSPSAIDSDDSDVPMMAENIDEKKRAEDEGMGLLKVNAANFSQMRAECSTEFKKLQKKYKATMIVTMNTLKKS